MFRTLVEGLVLGFSTGSICLATCTPIYLPFLISEKRKLTKSFMMVMEISLGRFFSYLAFGAAAGFIGTKIAAIDRNLYTSIAYILLSIFLVFSAIRTHRKSKKCHIPKLVNITKSAFLLGILTGVNFCPSFLIALSKAVDLAGAFSGMMLFFGFFLGTSVFLIPLAFIGQLSRLPKFTTIARVASVLIAIWFTYSGVKGIFHYHKMQQLEKLPSRLVEAFHPEIPLIIICEEPNLQYFTTLQDSLQKYSRQQVKLQIYEDVRLDSLTNKQFVMVQDASLEPENFDEFDRFIVEPGYPLARMMRFMKLYTFKTRTHLEWEFIEKE